MYDESREFVQSVQIAHSNEPPKCNGYELRINTGCLSIHESVSLIYLARF